MLPSVARIDPVFDNKFDYSVNTMLPVWIMNGLSKHSNFAIRIFGILPTYRGWVLQLCKHSIGACTWNGAHRNSTCEWHAWNIWAKGCMVEYWTCCSIWFYNYIWPYVVFWITKILSSSYWKQNDNKTFVLSTICAKHAYRLVFWMSTQNNDIADGL